MSRAEVDVPRLLDRLGVSARRRGRALWAPCPLPSHAEKEPSWSIVDAAGDEKHGGWHCFGCKAGGGPRDLVAAVLGVGEQEAAEWLKSGEVLRDRELPSAVVVRVLRPPRLFELPPGVVLGRPLPDWPTPARDYLTRRGVTAEQVARWGVGYAVEGRLTMRVVIPVRDAAGRLCSYVARAFVARIGGREAKRYLEPAEEEGADHAAVLGEHLWPRARDLAVISEGWFDGAAGERAAALLGVLAAPAVLHGSPGPGCAGWDAVAGKLATFRRLAVLVDPNAAGEALLAAVDGAIGRYAEVRAVRTHGTDAAGLAEREGDAALARLVGGVLRRRSAA